MKRFLWFAAGVVLLFAGCVVTTQGTTENTGGYPGRWEQAILREDEYGAQLRVERENGEVWAIEAKTYCFWTRQYVGKAVLFKWGPMESYIMNDSGQECTFWTRNRVE